MIRFRERHLGAEAEWDRGVWSGDPDLVHLLEIAARSEGILPFSHTPFGDVQAAMARKFAAWAIDVVAQTKPREYEWSDEDCERYGVP